MNDQPLISVIVPVYKVEPYLRKCLDSIVGQTYQNLEIIVVDDGSPDNCGAICDEYAAKDSRIQVIHKENGGVSTARNAGLAAATGEWIGWVDSDDWIEPDMYEYLLENAKEYTADIAVCGRVEIYRDKQIPRGWQKTQSLDCEEALEKLLENDTMQNYLWDKLWKKELFDGIWFPVGRTYEDIAVMHRLFQKAEKTVVLPEMKYYYFQRSESIVGDQRLQGKIYHFMAARQRLEEMYLDWPQFTNLLEAQCVASAIGIWCIYYTNPKEERNRVQSYLEEIATFAKEHQGIPPQMGLGLAGRIVAKLVPYDTWWAFSLAWGIGKLYYWKHGRAL